MRAQPNDREQGFTLLELLVVVLIVAILLAIAIPTFLGARERASDRAAQSTVRNAHTVEMIFYADGSRFTDDEVVLTRIDPSLRYLTGPAALPLVDTGGVVYVETDTGGHSPRADNTVYIAARSNSGRCFWLRTIGDEDHPRFAEGLCSVRPDDGEFVDSWD